MKKTFKKIAALLLAGALAATAALPALAEDETTYTLDVNNKVSEHTYTGYQVFTGTYDTDAGEWVDLKYGSDIAASITANNKTYTATPGALVPGELLKYLSDLTSVDPTASGVTEKSLASNSNEVVAELIRTFVKSDATGTVIPASVVPGYYIIEEKLTDGKTAPKPDSYSTAVAVPVYQATTVTLKKDVPTVEKKVKDVNDSKANSTTDPKNPTDWQDSADYDIGDEIPYKVTGTVAANYADYDSYTYFFTDTMTHLTYKEGSAQVVLDSESGTDITSSFDIAWDADTKTLTATAKGDKGLKSISGVTKDSKIILLYTAILDDEANIGATGNPNEVDLTYSNNPNEGGKGDTGTTEKDKNIVFTFEMVVNKVDAAGDALKGAGFTLYKKNADGEYVKVGDEVKGTELTTFEFKGLDDGDYKLSETMTPTGYNTIEDIEFTITAEHEEDNVDPKLTSFMGSTADTNTTVNLGTFEFTANKSTGSLVGDIVNNSGSTLPSTGGMGTTIFYVIGGILILAAAIILISRRRVQQ